MLRNYTSPFNATVIDRLEAAGAVIIGKTNMDEFAMGSGSVKSAFGPVRNPLNEAYSAGGSSGGSAAAVAAQTCLGAIGSDTGGSIRLPASYCGLVGLKPTYGKISRYGLIAYGSSLDCPAIVAQSASDVAILFDALKGYDAKDSTSCRNETTKSKESGLIVGVIEELTSHSIQDDVRNSWKLALNSLQSKGMQIVSVSIPSIRYALAVYYIISAAEASSNLARFSGLVFGGDPHHVGSSFEDLQRLISNNRTKGFGDEVKRRILTGSFVLSSKSYQSYFGKAEKIRTALLQEFNRVFEHCDVLVTPTAPSAALKIEEFINPKSPM